MPISHHDEHDVHLCMNDSIHTTAVPFHVPSIPETDRIRLETLCVDTLHRQRPLHLILLESDGSPERALHPGQDPAAITRPHLESLTRSQLRGTDLLIRINPNRLVCCLPDATRAAAENLARRLRNAIASSLPEHLSKTVRPALRIALVSAPEDGQALDVLLAAGMDALQHARRHGQQSVVSASRLRVERDEAAHMLESALRDNRVRPAYQAIVDLRDGKHLAEEALARVVSVHGKVIPASAFLDAARRLQLSHRIDQAILMQAVARRRHPPVRSGGVFVNISAELLQQPEAVATILDTATMTHAEASGSPLVLCVNEHELSTFAGDVIARMRALTERGLRVALNNFGSSDATYRWLADLPISFLRIDDALLTRIAEPRIGHIIQGICRTASHLGIVTLAGHIEDRETAQCLAGLGVDWGQGYFFGRPLLPDEGQ